MPSSTNPTQGNNNDNWFNPIPIDDYYKINEQARQNVPTSPPNDETLGNYTISCGPILRLAGTWENNNDTTEDPNYRGSILLVIKKDTDGTTANETGPAITYKIGPSSPSTTVALAKFSTGEFPGTKFYQENDYSFYRYSIELTLTGNEQKVEYFIDNHFKPNFQFYLPSKTQSMNVISYSCNGFSLGSDANEYKSSLWLDVLTKHSQQHYHVMLGGGDQIYCDAIKLHSERLKQWTEISNPIKKKSFPVDDEIIDEFKKFYLNHYLGWFGKGFWKGTNSTVLESLFPLSAAQIPCVNIYDDHDIIDGFGSYHDSTMNAPIFTAVGNIAYKYYMLFQHHINPEEKLHLSDPSWVLGSTTGPFIKQKNHSVFMRLGKEISLLGLDCRTERKLKQIVNPSTYNIIFDRLKKELTTTTTATTTTKHLLVMLGVPILYPRLVWLEKVLTSTALIPIRKLAQKGVIAKGLVNEFDGDVEVLDDLNDHWCSKHHKAERNRLIKRLQEFGAANGIRITILSGDVHLGCIGRLKSKFHSHAHAHAHKFLHNVEGDHQLAEKLNKDVIETPEYDPRLIFNITSSAIVNAPPPDAMATLLNKRSGIHHFNRDTDEDIVPLFIKNLDGSNRDNKQFLNERNWSDLILAKQSILYKDQFTNDDDDDDENPIRKFPQPVLDNKGEDLLKDQTFDSRHVKYPLYSDSLVTTLRFEKDKSDLSSPSVGYEVLIPKLFGKYKLDPAPVKHVDQ